MKTNFLIALMTVALFSCKKTKTTEPEPEPFTIKDTLSSGWSRLPGIGEQIISDIFFTDALRGYACGNYGIYRSENGGNTWAQIRSTSAFNIGAYGISQAAFVRGDEEVIITDDGSQTTIATHPVLQSTGFTDLFLLDVSTCFFSSVQYMWKSTDGGHTIDTLYHFPESSSGNNAIFFLNQNIGWTNRNGKIYKTSNGGIDWQLLSNFSSGEDGSIYFFSENVGYVAIGQTLYKTSDGGAHFNMIFSDQTGSLTFDFSFIDVDNGYLCHSGSVYKTINGGLTWEKVAGSNVDLIELHFVDAHHGWVCGSNGTILKYQN